MKTGQISIEFLLILAASAGMLTAFLLGTQQILQAAQWTQEIQSARQFMQEIKESTHSLSALGESSTQTIQGSHHGEWEMEARENSLALSVRFKGKEKNFTIQAPIPLQANLQTVPASFQIRLRRENEQILIEPA
ncbi:MAG: hypothetical protein HY917_01125 [Candidatus Diapherotrites archaeon]|nr:hypothetical protein [Candidatus Diapherotrites archaeon]